MAFLMSTNSSKLVNNTDCGLAGGAAVASTAAEADVASVAAAVSGDGVATTTGSDTISTAGAAAGVSTDAVDAAEPRGLRDLALAVEGVEDMMQRKK